MSDDGQDEQPAVVDDPSAVAASTTLLSTVRSEVDNASTFRDESSSHDRSSIEMRDLDPETKLKDPNVVTSEKLLMGPPELHRHDDRRPGAFRAGGNTETTQSFVSRELQDSSHLPIPVMDVPLNAELVDESAIEYVKAEPVVLTPLKEDAHMLKAMRKSGKRWSAILALIVFFLGASAIVVSVVIVVQADDEPEGENRRANAPRESLHAVVWGYQSDCKSVRVSPLQIACPGHIALLQMNGTNCSVSEENVTECETRDSASVVVFLCSNDQENMSLQATVTMPSAVATNCSNSLSLEDGRRRKLSSLPGNVTFGGTAETYVALGRFCQDSGFMVFRNSYSCQSGQLVQGLPQSMYRQLEESPPNYCVRNKTCEVEIACETEQFCEADCRIELGPLQVTSAEKNCELRLDLGRDANISDELKQEYWDVIEDHMLQHMEDSGDGV